MSAARTGPSRYSSRERGDRRERECSSMVLSGSAAADWPSRVTERDATKRAGRSTMAIVQRNVQIKRSPQEAVALWSDASRCLEWYSGMPESDIGPPFPDQWGR